MSFEVDGLKCSATLYWPASAEVPVACVVMGHGFSLTRRDGIPDYAERFAAAGLAVLAFDYRYWGDSEGEPRRWFSLRRQLADWRAAVMFARGLEGVDPDRIAVWGMSMGGGHALTTAATDPRVAGVVAVVPIADGLAVMLQPAPPRVGVWLIGRALRAAITRRAVMVPVAGPPGSFAVLDAPEALPGFTRLAADNEWRNEVNAAGLLATAGYRPVRKAVRIAAPVLLQLGERDAMAPLPPIEKTATRARRSELRRYPIDHFQCFWPEHIDRVTDDQIDFLRRHLLASQAPPDETAAPTR
jgi:pimeloyl-ACP methyl ester carboxylesterase